MADSGDGFFGSGGTLRSDALKSSGYESWKRERTDDGENTNAQAADEAAAATAAAITDAAVYTMSARLQVGETGYDAGAAEMVNEAVASALAKLSPSGSSTAPSPSWGTYQNSLIAASKAASLEQPSSPPPAPEAETPAPAEDELESLARKYVERGEKLGHGLSAEERKQKVAEVKEFYKEKKERLKSVVDAEG